MTYVDAAGNYYLCDGSTWYAIVDRIYYDDENDDLGFVQALLPVASVASSLIGGAKARRAQEQARDQQREAAYAAIRQIKDDMLACRITPPEDAVRQAQDVVRQYYAWADQNLTITSVRQSAENFRTQPMGFNDSVKAVADKVDEARARCAPRQPSQQSAGASVKASASGIPLWALAALGAVLLLR